MCCAPPKFDINNPNAGNNAFNNMYKGALIFNLILGIGILLLSIVGIAQFTYYFVIKDNNLGEVIQNVVNSMATGSENTTE